MTQRSALTEGEKQYLKDRKEQGASLVQIAQELDCSRETTRKWWRIQRAGKRVGSRGRPRHGVLSTYSEEMREKVVAIKKAHPHWGPNSIKLELRHDPEWSEKRMPSNAQLSILLRQACPEAIQPHQRRPTHPTENKVHVVHQRWQIDIKEGVRVGSDWVNIDEVREIFSATMLAARAVVATTPKYWRHLGLRDHQQTLRASFQTWGLPLEVQTDHDGSFVNPEDPQFPSRFTLWLVGLGIRHVTSRPHRPTDQGAIERNHRTLGDFAWKDQAFDQVSGLQEALDRHRQRYNQEYPSQAAHCHGCPPLIAFPTACHSGRSYHPALEWDTFRMDWVDAYLAKLVWTRNATGNGIVNLGHQVYFLGRNFKGQLISIRFQPNSRSFCFFMIDGTLIRELPALGLEKEDILGFIPADLTLPIGFQFPLPLPGV